MEKCANCDRTIGNLETPHVHNGHVVCVECKSKLRPIVIDDSDVVKPVADTFANRLDSMPVARPANYQPTPYTPRAACPACGSAARAIKKSKGSSLLLICLLVLWIIPGLIYAIVYSGYVYVCPHCGYKYGDAS